MEHEKYVINPMFVCWKNPILSKISRLLNQCIEQKDLGVAGKAQEPKFPGGFWVPIF